MSSAALVDQPDRRIGGTTITTACLVAFVLLSVAPAALVSIPAMVDYPNHLARMSILARAGTQAAHPLYEVRWVLAPNLAMDLLVPPLARLIGVETATRLFYVASQLLIVSGAALLSMAERGRAAGAAFAATTLLYCVPFAWGFMNFEFALGLALWGMAGFVTIGSARPGLRWSVHALVVALLFVAHLFALGLYTAVLGALELSRLATARAPIRAYLASAAALALPLAGAALALWVCGGAVGGSHTAWMFDAKLAWPFSLNGFDRPVSITLTMILVMLGYVGLRQRWIRMVGAGPVLAAVFALLYLAMPFRLFDTAFVDVRVLIGAAMILPAFTTVVIPAGLMRTAATATVFGVAAVNLATVGLLQASYRRDYAETLAAFEGVERGARILVADSGEAPDPPADLSWYPMTHAATLAVMTRDAFVPTLFTHPGKQPIVPAASIRHLAIPEGGAVPLNDLLALAKGAPANDSLRFVADWTREFDYLFVIRSGDDLPPADGLVTVATGRRFALLRITSATRRSTEP